MNHGLCITGYKEHIRCRPAERNPVPASVTCPSCGKRLKVPDGAAGRRASCSKCGAAIALAPGEAGGRRAPDGYALNSESASVLSKVSPDIPPPPPSPRAPATAASTNYQGVAARRKQTQIGIAVGTIVLALLTIGAVTLHLNRNAEESRRDLAHATELREAQARAERAEAVAAEASALAKATAEGIAAKEAKAKADAEAAVRAAATAKADAIANAKEKRERELLTKIELLLSKGHLADTEKVVDEYLTIPDAKERDRVNHLAIELRMIWPDNFVEEFKSVEAEYLNALVVVVDDGKEPGLIDTIRPKGVTLPLVKTAFQERARIVALAEKARRAEFADAIREERKGMILLSDDASERLDNWVLSMLPTERTTAVLAIVKLKEIHQAYAKDRSISEEATARFATSFTNTTLRVMIDIVTKAGDSIPADYGNDGDRLVTVAEAWKGFRAKCGQMAAAGQRFEDYNQPNNPSNKKQKKQRPTEPDK